MLLHTLFPTDEDAGQRRWRHREDAGQHRPLIWPSMAIYMLLCFSVHKQCSVVKRPRGTPSFVWNIKDSIYPLCLQFSLLFNISCSLYSAKNQCKQFNINSLVLKLQTGKEIKVLSLWCTLCAKKEEAAFRRCQNQWDCPQADSDSQWNFLLLT